LKNEISAPTSWRIKPSPMTFGGVPMGVARPRVIAADFDAGFLFLFEQKRDD
jgi:hypothetical protein